MIPDKYCQRKPTGAFQTGGAPFLLCLLFLASQAFSQSSGQLDLLIFDPVRIDPATGQELGPRSVPIQFLPTSDTGPDLNVRESPESNEADELSALEITRNITAYEDAVRDLEAEGGPFAPDLFEVLVDLGSQYQLGGEHESAIEIFERAEHISRVNNGLYHPEQYASVEKMIDSYMAMGDFASATERYRYLVYLHEQHYGQADPNILPSLVGLADHNMQYFNRVMTMPEQPTISFSSSSSSSGFGAVGRDPTAKEMAFGSLFMAQQHYLRAIGTMISNQQFFDPMLLNLEYNFLETLLLQSFRSAILEDTDYYLSDRRTTTGSLIRRDSYRRYSSGFTNGKDAFERILIYIRNNPEARVYQLVNALMEYGDWNILFGKSQSAHDKYLEAYALVQDLNVDPGAVEELFRPEMPVHLPLVTAKPNSREKFGIAPDTELEYEGYIDMSFTISRFGRAKRFESLATSGNVTNDIERRLVRYLRNSPFRPRLNEDERFDSTRVTMRYYFTFADQGMI